MLLHKVIMRRIRGFSTHGAIELLLLLDRLLKRVPIDLQDFMYCYGVRAGGGRNWLFAVDQFAKSTNLLQSLRLAKSLSCIEDEDVLNVYGRYAYKNVPQNVWNQITNL